jgi:hypothetical protein
MLRLIFLLALLPQFCFAQTVDYVLEENWAALPFKQNATFWTPENSDLVNNQQEARADVFFVHPTTDVFGLKVSGNTKIDNKRVNKQTDRFAMKYQASVFNGSCKIYAPRYRQAALHNFFSKNTQKSRAAFDTAYADVRAAFEFYLKNYNKGRPIIIAGHSQGSMLAARLLKEFFDGKPLQSRLIAAYLIGYPIFANQFQYLKVADHQDSLGGIIAYNTFLMETDNFITDYQNAIAVNPLNWQTGNIFVDASKHLGAIKKNKENIYKNLFGAKCGAGILEIQKPHISGYPPLMKNNYHLHDYSLFYVNLRENIAHRVNLYLEMRE